MSSELNKIQLPSPGKLNLFLHITDRRADGYHQLQTLFQFIELADELTFSLRTDAKIQLTSDLPFKAEDNLVYKAAATLQQAAQISQGIDILLDKKLPIGGGVGGGSSNAATTLLALNKLWQLNWSLSQLAELGITLGADVPIFIHGFAAWAEGIGEKLTPVTPKELWYLLLAPDCHVSTAKIFNHPNLPRSTAPVTFEDFLANRCHNDCEFLVRNLYPGVDKCFQFLNNLGPVRMTGTGACLFVPFDCHSDAAKAFAQLPNGMQGFITKGSNQSMLHRCLQSLSK
ncbi:4-(cytidine 5'-diphospho)-2-C-methyl-D-erythritol kinase [Endozoicomonas sp. SM1973]|uniref:4-diphosphocytidyl-2-C-methyl-D-erythritol kinase n=1 Tax=Spartinivicinus marinus TaxID=2994442 RepID=A0A853I821_9GAMM|nr:4-(cytidine 5'-diphospho)-2-C-methyl-D-erythritol kinase [Spartinivicinus marinus]MCX4028100.1 4-(cytidine 5'-diphospho)-2-C-methyl-D-erythritol kinase [Spartinivicinus marinus]NYZ66224.1 4-(cytidine 5'-diphospho)-2-C-methyl-D-erythritol kinase [Spartinivicinus marinus]